MPEAFMAFLGPSEPQVFQGRKVTLGQGVFQELALEGLMVNQAPQVFGGTQGPRAALAPLETRDCWGPTVRKVRWDPRAKSDGLGPMDNLGPLDHWARRV